MKTASTFFIRIIHSQTFRFLYEIADAINITVWFCRVAFLVECGAVTALFTRFVRRNPMDIQ